MAFHAGGWTLWSNCPSAVVGRSVSSSWSFRPASGGPARLFLYPLCAPRQVFFRPAPAPEFPGHQPLGLLLGRLLVVRAEVAGPARWAAAAYALLASWFVATPLHRPSNRPDQELAVVFVVIEHRAGDALFLGVEPFFEPLGGHEAGQIPRRCDQGEQ